MRGKENAGAESGPGGTISPPVVQLRGFEAVSKVGWHSNASSERASTLARPDSDSCFMLARIPRCVQ